MEEGTITNQKLVEAANLADRAEVMAQDALSLAMKAGLSSDNQGYQLLSDAAAYLSDAASELRERATD